MPPLIQIDFRLSSDEMVPVTGLSDAVNLTRYQDGAFYWLDQVFSEDEPGLISISVPKDSYYSQAGYRVSDSQTAFQMKYLDLSETDSLFYTYYLSRLSSPVEEKSTS